MANFKSDLARMLREVRLSRGFSQQEVATLLHVSRPTYSYYETARVLPDIETLKKLAGIYSISPELFFYPERFPGQEKDW